ncbi:MAG: FkbM family methyltransferase [Alphaproteobacteria bacterium]|nr:FkbM family methyltransferase [Alphaproteobacteria bacterium]
MDQARAPAGSAAPADGWATVEALVAAGEIAAARDRAFAVLAAAPDDLTIKRNVAFLVFDLSLFADFRPAVAFLRECIALDPDDKDVMRRLAHMNWVCGNAEEAMAMGLRLIVLDPSVLGHFLDYASYCLTAGRPEQALLASAAVVASMPEDLNAKSRMALARLLALDRRVVRARLDDVELLFELTARNGQRMGSDLIHVSGALGEAEELRTMRRAVDPGGTVVEVGLLVGNHFLFFLKALRPRRLIGFEGDRDNLALVERNIGYNRAASPAAFEGTAIVLRHALIGDKVVAGDEGAPGAPALDGQLVSLDEALASEQRVDLVKIDVDGMELDVLRGMRATMQRFRPVVMIEVERTLAAQARALLAESGYAVAARIERDVYANWLVAPADRIAEVQRRIQGAG